jgi:hypothetical protein
MKGLSVRYLPRHAGRATLAVVALGLVVGAGILVVEQWEVGGPAPAVGVPLPVGDTRSLAPAVGCTYRDRVGRDVAELAVSIRGIDVDALAMTLQVSLCLPQPFLERLVELPNDKPALVFREEAEGIYVKQAKTKVLVSYFSQIPIPKVYSAPFTVETTLGRLVNGPPNPVSADLIPTFSPQVSLGTIQVPLAAAAQRYPFDWYASRGFFFVGFAGTRIGVRGAHGIPFHVHMYTDPAIAPLVAGVGASREPGTSGFEMLTIRLTRSQATLWYVSLIAAIPLLLTALLAYTLLRRSANSGLGAEAVVGVTAVILAVLPIRLVLVPASAPELTLVDYWLGFEMAVLVALACLAVRSAL